MTDPVELHAAHVTMTKMAQLWAQRSAELKAEGKKKEAKAAWNTAQEWLRLADKVQELSRP